VLELLNKLKLRGIDMGVAKYVKNEKDGIEEVIYQSGIRVKPVYTPQDLDEVGFDYKKDLGDPG